MQDDRSPDDRRPSTTGVAACLIAAPLIVLELGLLVAVMAGVKDNQGVLYAAFPTLGALVLGFPACFLVALWGMRERDRSPTFAWLGLLLSLGVAVASFLVLYAARLAR
jgi:uncharacterized membrane protein YozB (DUF420 family)